MLKRNVRLRKEYLWKKAMQQKENIIKERKRRIKEALDKGKPIRPEDRDFELEHRDTTNLEDEQSLRPVSITDNEYAFSGIKDPKIIITTSRNPSNRLMQFVKELNLLIPNAFRINRGTYVVKEIVQLGQTKEASDIIMVHEHRGVPNSLILCHLPLGPTFYFELKDVVLRHDMPEAPPPMSTAAPHLIFHNFASKLGQRVMTGLKYLFPPPSNLKTRVLSFVNHHDIVHFRHYIWTDQRTEFTKQEDVLGKDEVQENEPLKIESKRHKKNSNHESQVKLVEVGPRFQLKPYRIELGTPDMVETEVEWSLKVFLNVAKEVLA